MIEHPFIVKKFAQPEEERTYSPAELAAYKSGQLCALRALKEALQKSIANEKDANRYRKLRNQHWESSYLFVVTGGKSSVKLGVDCPSGARLDALVDALSAGTVDVSGGDDRLVPGRWWRVLDPSGALWCETSNEAEARGRMREGDTLYRIHERTIHEWRSQT